MDDKHQIIVEAQAHGTGSEQALLMPMVEAAHPLCTPDTLITADAGYHSDANLKALAEQDRPALIDAQWKLFCLVHNIEKLAHHGYAQ